MYETGAGLAIYSRKSPQLEVQLATQQVTFTLPPDASAALLGSEAIEDIRWDGQRLAVSGQIQRVLEFRHREPPLPIITEWRDIWPARGGSFAPDPNLDFMRLMNNHGKGLRLRNATDKPLQLWIEPHGDVIVLRPFATVAVDADSVEGIELDRGVATIYGLPESITHELDNGKQRLLWPVPPGDAKEMFDARASVGIVPKKRGEANLGDWYIPPRG